MASICGDVLLAAKVANYRIIYTNLQDSIPMRSLPPPRITRKRRWRRFKRAIKYFFKTGKLTDPSSPNYRFKSQSISKIKQSRITSRLRRSNFTKSDQFLRSSTNAGMKTASFVGKLVTRSMPVLKPFSSSNSLNVQVRF